MAMYIPGQGRQAVRVAGQHVALPGGGLALGIVTQATANQAAVP